MSENKNDELVVSTRLEEPGLERLMQDYQRGDRASAEELMKRLVPILRRFFLSNLDSRQTSEDLVQETLLRLHRARHSYRPNDAVLPWVYAIARHTKVDQYRKRLRTAKHEEQTEPEVLHNLQGDPQVGHEQTTDFETLMTYLPQSQREVITMLKVLGMSVEEVARVTSSSVGSVKQKAHRAYEKLRMVLAKTSGGKGGEQTA
jgi:RNA polymerase sigma-70 factor (ECF subfamily)